MRKSKLGLMARSGLTMGNMNMILIFLTLINVYPLLCLLLNSLGLSARNHHFNLHGYMEVFQEPQFLIAFNNTIFMALAITFLSLVIGCGLAWFLNKTDLKSKKMFDFLIVLTYFVPSYILAVALIEILGPVGILGRLFEGADGLTKMPFNIYSLTGVVLVMTIHLYPLVYMAVSNAFKGCERSLEEAALLDGEGRMGAFFKIILPSIMPSIFSVGLFVFAHSVSCFGVASLLALPARKYILPTYIYISLASLKFSKATAMAVLLAMLSGLIYFLQMKSNNKKIKLISGGFYSETKMKLGKFRPLMETGFYMFFGVTIIFPLIVILFASILKSWGIEWIPENFTLDNYRQVLFSNPKIVRSIFNSIVFGFIAASIATFLGSLALYLGIRFGGYQGKIIDFVLSWPMAIPDVVLAVAAILTWINPPVKLYGTPWIIIITYVTAGLPFVIRNVRGLIDNLDPELEEIAWTFGATTMACFKKVVIPLIKPGLKTGWICVFLFALHEIPVSTLLYAPGTETVGVMLYGLRSDTGGLELISALAVVLLVIICAGRLFGRKIEAIDKM